MLHIELSSDCVSELDGELDRSSATGGKMEFALGVGKLSPNGDVIPGRNCSFWGGACRMETCGVFSIRVFRSCARGSAADMAAEVGSVAAIVVWAKEYFCR